MMDAQNSYYLTELDDRSRKIIRRKAGQCCILQRIRSFLGMIAVADPVKKTSAEAIREMEQMGLDVVMLTGDHEKTARAIQKAAWHQPRDRTGTSAG